MQQNFKVFFGCFPLFQIKARKIVFEKRLNEPRFTPFFEVISHVKLTHIEVMKGSWLKACLTMKFNIHMNMQIDGFMSAVMTLKGETDVWKIDV